MELRTLAWAFSLLAAASPAFGQSYGLGNLRPLSLSQKMSGSNREALLHFENEQGEHYILYEENPAFGGVKEIASLVSFIGNSNHICSIDLDCQSKAFCTSGCKKLYYEVFNSAAPSGRNSCAIKAFTCSVQNPLPSSGPPPAPSSGH